MTLENTMLTISDKAADKIKSLLAQEEKSATDWGLRVAVEGGGCSGFQYQLDFTEVREEDNVYEHSDAKVLVDAKSILLLGGSTVDYIESLTGAGFTIRNPQSTGTCGCGQSFSV